MSYAGLLIDKYRSRGLMLDSNLLLLYLVGTANPALVGAGTYNKLSQFTVMQVTVLKQLVSLFQHVVTTAHILTEVSNLVGTMHGEGRSRVLQAFADTLEVISEQEISSYQVAQ